MIYDWANNYSSMGKMSRTVHRVRERWEDATPDIMQSLEGDTESET